MEYTYNGILFKDVDISSSYSNVGAKLKPHGITNINNNEDLSKYSLLDSIFINWNKAVIPDINSDSNKEIFSTSDLFIYLTNLTSKIKELEKKLNDYNDSKLYKINLNLSYLTYTGDSFIYAYTTNEAPTKITLNTNTYFSRPTSITVENCSYNYDSSSGIISLYKPTNDVNIFANGIAIQYDINYENIENENIELSNKPELNKITYLTKEGDINIGIKIKNNYKIDDQTLSISGCENDLIVSNETSASLKLWHATNNISLPKLKIYKLYNVNKGELTNCSMTNGNVKVYDQTTTYNITFNVDEGYELKTDNITVNNATKVSLSGNTLKINNIIGDVTITATATIIKEQIEYILFGLDRYNTGDDLQPNADTFTKIINNTYKVDSPTDDEAVEMDKLVTTDKIVNYLDDTASNRYYHNLLVKLKNISTSKDSPSKKDVRFNHPNHNNYNHYILIPESYEITKITGINSDSDVKNDFIKQSQTVTYDNIIYNIYKYTNNSRLRGFEKNISIYKK